MSGSQTGDEPAPTYTKSFWIGLALGTPLVVYGVLGVLEFRAAALRSFVVYFVGGAALHDLVIAPAVCAVGWGVSRIVAPPARAPVQAALIASAVVALVAWPFVRAYGITPGEPSFLSRNYTVSLLVSWGVIWSVAVVVAVSRTLNARRR